MSSYSEAATELQGPQIDDSPTSRILPPVPAAKMACNWPADKFWSDIVTAKFDCRCLLPEHRCRRRSVVASPVVRRG